MQRRVVHAEEEVRLARLDGLAAVERRAPGALCAVEELLVELGAAHVVARVVARIVVAGGDRAYWWREATTHTGGASVGSGGARAEEVLRRVDDGVPDGVEHLEGRVSSHGVQRGARM